MALPLSLAASAVTLEDVPVAALALLALVLLACVVAGRLIATHAAPSLPSRADMRTPLTALTAGLGLLTLWWLVLMPTLGAGNLVTAGLFGLSVTGLAGAMFRVWRRHPEESHGNALFIAMALAAWPLLVPLAGLVWQTAGQLQAAQLVHQLARFPGWPDAIQYATYSLPMLSGNPPAWLALWLPVQGAVALDPTPSGPWPGLMGLLNGLLLLAVAAHLLAVLHVPVRWSNLLLCATGGLLMLVPLLPLGLAGALTQPGPMFLSMAAALALYSPLVSVLPLPTGVAALLAALAGAALTGLHPLGLPLALLAALLWAVRGLLTGALAHPLSAGRFVFAVSALACLPLLTFLLWQNAQTALGHSLLPSLLNALAHPSLLPPLLTLLLPPADEFLCLWPIAVLLFVPLALLRLMPTALLTPGALLVTHAPLTVPALLALLLLPLLCLPATRPLAAALSQVLLVLWVVPLAHTYHHLYRRSALQKAAFAHPWWIGLMFATLVLTLSLAWQPRLVQTPDPGSATLAAMGEELRTRPLVSFGQPVATLGYAYPATTMLAFTLAHYAPATSVPPGLKTRPQLHAWMRRNGLTWLLANGRDAATARLLGVAAPLPSAMLFRADADALTLTAVWGAGTMDRPPRASGTD